MERNCSLILKLIINFSKNLKKNTFIILIIFPTLNLLSINITIFSSKSVILRNNSRLLLFKFRNTSIVTNIIIKILWSRRAQKLISYFIDISSIFCNTSESLRRLFKIFALFLLLNFMTFSVSVDISQIVIMSMTIMMTVMSISMTMTMIIIMTLQMIEMSMIMIMFSTLIYLFLKVSFSL